MGRTCGRRLARGVLTIVGTTTAFWLLLVVAFPTGWLNRRLVSALETSTGQEIALDRVRLGLLGTVQLQGLSIQEPGSGRAWLRVVDLGLELDWGRLVSGHLDVSRVDARGIDLEVQRYADGSFTFASLLEHHKPARLGPAGQTWIDRDEQTVRFEFQGMRILYDDEPMGTRLAMHDLRGHGSWQKHRVTLDRMEGRLNEGTVALEGSIERGLGSPTCELQVVARHVELTPEMDLLGYVVPVLAGSSSELEGRMNLNVYVRGQVGEATAARGLVGQGRLQVDPIRLRHSPLVGELVRTLRLDPAVEVGSVRSGFTLAGGRVLNDELVIQLGDVPLVLSGCTELDGRFDYRIRTDRMASAWSGTLAKVLGELPVQVDDLVELRVTGTPQKMRVTLEGMPLEPGRAGQIDETEQFREVARRLRDRLLR